MRRIFFKIERALLVGIIILPVVLSFVNSTLNQNIDWGKNSNLLAPVPHYVVYKTNSPVSIDGEAKETDWDRVEWMSDFGDIRGDKWPKPFLETRTKLMWDMQNLYVYAELEESNLQANMVKRDDLLYEENNFEIFIDPDGSTHDYYEFEVNVLNTVFDLFLTKPYRDRGTALFSWNSDGFQSAVRVNGTINNSNDVDKNWIVEMKIPFADLRKGANVKVPKDREMWKVNLMRVEWEGGNAADKKINPDGIKTHYWTWSPQGVISMHCPERWGMIQFSENEVGNEIVEFEMPSSEKLNKYLWLVYHKQQEFKRAHGTYATSLEEISMPEQIVTEFKNGKKSTIQMWATSKQFTVEIGGENEIISLNETGMLSKRRK